MSLTNNSSFLPSISFSFYLTRFAASLCKREVKALASFSLVLSLHLGNS